MRSPPPVSYFRRSAIPQRVRRTACPASACSLSPRPAAFLPRTAPPSRSFHPSLPLLPPQRRRGPKSQRFGQCPVPLSAGQRPARIRCPTFRIHSASVSLIHPLPAAAVSETKSNRPAGFPRPQTLLPPRLLFFSSCRPPTRLAISPVSS